MKAILPKHLNDIEAIELIHGPPPEILGDENLRFYQNWMVEKAVDLPGLLLGAEMGLGKTGAVLKALTILLGRGEIKHVLIVAPLKVAEETWPEEIAKWAFARGLTYKVVTGTLDERMAALSIGPTQLTIINRENLVWLYSITGMRAWRYDALVYDEASRLKAGRKKTKPQPRADGTVGTKRRTELGVINAVRHRLKHVIELSGTPSPEGLIDLWGPIFALDQGKRLGTTRTAYENRWFRTDPYTRKVEPFDHAHEQIMERVSDIFFSLKEEDYLKLPPLVPVDHYVTLSAAEMRRYKQFEKDAALEVRNRRGDREVIAAVNGGVLTQKLLQFANGSLYLGDKFDEETDQRLPRESVKVHDHKLTVLDSILEEAMGTPVLVAYSFQFDKEAIVKKFPFCRVFGDSVHDKRDWDNGRIKMLLTHPASAGHGLNLQRGSNIMVWYGLTHSLELYQQFVKRLHRSGQQRDKVFLHRIMAKNTVDELILPRLIEKGATQSRITDAVRVRLERLAA